MLAGGLSLLGMIAAAILLVPLLTNLLSRWLEVICGAILGNEGRLSARNMRDIKIPRRISHCCLSASLP